ncbi:Histone-lysine N-methyltransferase SETMAR [Araneus ventricosus]|uniref:Histone-lysine N-methyltransferase SETMAR n=1 Tax=Araneus ventricosus TaxID=182803 RepID=A0A4Y2I9V8_ARAVE|nr:Histone-lysine N-methyltransferase SETMAR [Araneus ventricosus]
MLYSSAASSLSQVITAFKQKHRSRISGMETIFWDRKGVLLVDFMPKGTTINANRYCEALKKLRRAIQNRRRGIVLLHGNARPHTYAATQELLDQFGWEIFDHPPYNPDLAPNDFHLFLKLKELLGGKRFGSDEELENAVITWLNELAAEEYAMGILKLKARYDKCLNVGGDYVEK